MTTLTNRPGTALLVIDVQKDVMAESWHPQPVIDRIAALVDRARVEAVPVVWVQHSDEGMPRDSDGWQLVDELVPAAGEARVHKSYGDAFEGTDLEDVLSALSVGRVVVAGAETDACVRSTIHGAFVRGYDTVLVGDAHTAGDKSAWGAPPVPDVIAHTNLYWQFQGGPGKTAEVVTAADVALS